MFVSHSEEFSPSTLLCACSLHWVASGPELSVITCADLAGSGSITGNMLQTDNVDGRLQSTMRMNTLWLSLSGGSGSGREGGLGNPLPGRVGHKGGRVLSSVQRVCVGVTLGGCVLRWFERSGTGVGTSLGTSVNSANMCLRHCRLHFTEQFARRYGSVGL